MGRRRNVLKTTPESGTHKYDRACQSGALCTHSFVMWHGPGKATRMLPSRPGGLETRAATSSTAGQGQRSALLPAPGSAAARQAGWVSVRQRRITAKESKYGGSSSSSVGTWAPRVCRRPRERPRLACAPRGCVPGMCPAWARLGAPGAASRACTHRTLSDALCTAAFSLLQLKCNRF